MIKNKVNKKSIVEKKLIDLISYLIRNSIDFNIYSFINSFFLFLSVIYSIVPIIKITKK